MVISNKCRYICQKVRKWMHWHKLSFLVLLKMVPWEKSIQQKYQSWPFVDPSKFCIKPHGFILFRVRTLLTTAQGTLYKTRQRNVRSRGWESLLLIVSPRNVRKYTHIVSSVLLPKHILDKDNNHRHIKDDQIGWWQMEGGMPVGGGGVKAPNLHTELQESKEYWEWKKSSSPGKSRPMN